MLSKLTTNQIRKKAEEKYPSSDYEPIENAARRVYYRQGATAWAIWKEKAEGYKKALKEIKLYGKGWEKEIATKALESFNQNKVKQYGKEKATKEIKKLLLLKGL